MPTKRALFLHVAVLAIVVLLLLAVKSSWKDFGRQVFAQYPTDTPTRTPTNTSTPTRTPTATAVPTGWIVFVPPDDAHVRDGSPDSNYGNETFLRGKSSGDNYDIYLKFEVTGIPAQPVQSAFIRLYVNDYSDDAGTMYSVSNDYQGTSTAWTEGGITWNNAPTIGGTALSSGGVASLDTWVEFDVTDVVTGDGTYSFAITTGSTNSVFYNSSEAATNQPQLVIIMKPGPTATPTITPTATISPTPTSSPTPGGPPIIDDGGSGGNTNIDNLSIGPINGGTAKLYVLSVDERPGDTRVNQVQGLGLVNWQRRIIQCAGRNQHTVELWTAFGDAVSGNVDITLNQAAEIIVGSVISYTNIDATLPVENVTGANTTGQDTGDCTSGTDNADLTIDVTTSQNNTVIFTASGIRGRNIQTPDSFYTERSYVTAGSTLNLYNHDRTLASPGMDTFNMTLSGTVDWAVAALAIRSPQPPTPTFTPTPTFYQVYGYIYTETNSDADTRSGAPAEGLLGGYQVDMTGDANNTTSSQANPLALYPANYVFTPIYNGIYNIEMPVVPTGSVLFNPQHYTNPQVAIAMGGPVIVDFPFVTITPTYPPEADTPTPPGGGFPTHTPSPTDILETPTSFPTPTSLLPPPGSTITPGGDGSVPPGSTITPGGDGVPPGSTITPGGDGSVPPGSTITPGGDGSVPPGSTITPGGEYIPPGSTITPGGEGVPPGSTITPGGEYVPPGSTITPNPVGCQALPTPDLRQPPHELCTNTKPLFSAYVEDPNGDNVWAHYYSNSYEKFDEYGSVVSPLGAESLWNPGPYTLNYTGGYWWTAYTESSSCPRSADAPARLLTMDYSPPPAPDPPTCTVVSQNYVTGETTFECTWNEVVVTNGCAYTSSYHPYFWASPGGGFADGGDFYDPGWIGNETTITVVTTDGEELYGIVEAMDNLGNISDSSDIGGPYNAPKINYSFTPTPGGPVYTPTPTPTPTITPTPTPGAWIQIKGGNVYQPNIFQPIPAGQYFLDLMPTPSVNPNSAGVIWSLTGKGSFGSGGSSPIEWEAPGELSNAYSFTYYWEALKSKAKTVNNSVVGVIDVPPPVDTLTPTPVVSGHISILQTVSGYLGDGGGNSFTLNSWTPELDNLVLVAISMRNNTGGDPTVSGNNLNFVQVAKSANTRIPAMSTYLFRAMGSSPTTGSITVYTPGNTKPVVALASRFSGVDTSGINGSGAIEAIAISDAGAIDTNDMKVDITSLSSDVWVYAAGYHRNANFTVPSGETPISINNIAGTGGDHAYLSAWYEEVSTPASVTIGADNDLTSTTPWSAISISIKKQ